METFFKEALEQRKELGLLRDMPVLESGQNKKIIIDKKEVLNFCSNDYLGLANDLRIKKAAIDAIKEYGVGAGASRLVCGNTTLHKKLEEKIASFKEQETSLVFSSGYIANLGIISTLMDKDSIIFSDRLNHASIIDGIILSRANLRRYQHNDISSLEELLAKSRDFKNKLIVTDTVFSMDGDIAPLPEIVQLAKAHNCLLMVDEAHATGVFGEGKGIVKHFNLVNKVDIQMGTLSKAIGSLGGYICGSKDLIQYLINFTRSFIYTTALPPAMCAASLKAIEIIEDEPERRERLWNNINFMKDSLKNLGLDTLKSQSAIIPILTKEPGLTMEFSKKLLKQGVFIQGIRPPTVPDNQSRLRLTVTSNHTPEDLEFALEKIKIIAKETCLI